MDNENCKYLNSLKLLFNVNTNYLLNNKYFSVIGFYSSNPIYKLNNFSYLYRDCLYKDIKNLSIFNAVLNFKCKYPPLKRDFSYLELIYRSDIQILNYLVLKDYYKI